MTLSTLFLLTGCGEEPIEVADDPLFCDIEERRVFTQEELDWRAENAPWNLRRDFKTNTAWDEECVEELPVVGNAVTARFSG